MIASVHLIPNLRLLQFEAQLRRLRTLTETFSQCVPLLAGDWNFSADGDGRMDYATGKFGATNSARCAAFERTFGHLAEAWQPNATHQETRRDENGFLSTISDARLDRIYLGLFND